MTHQSNTVQPFSASQTINTTIGLVSTTQLTDNEIKLQIQALRYQVEREILSQQLLALLPTRNTSTNIFSPNILIPLSQGTAPMGNTQLGP